MWLCTWLLDLQPLVNSDFSNMLPVGASKMLAVSGHEIRNMRMKQSAGYGASLSLAYHQESIGHITEIHREQNNIEF